MIKSSCAAGCTSGIVPSVTYTTLHASSNEPKNHECMVKVEKGGLTPRLMEVAAEAHMIFYLFFMDTNPTFVLLKSPHVMMYFFLLLVNSLD